MTSDFDLNSLIEGVVDDDSEGARSDLDEAKTPVALYREVLQVNNNSQNNIFISHIGQPVCRTLQDVCNDKV